MGTGIFGDNFHGTFPIRAYNTFPQKDRALKKLSAFGFKGDLLELITSFLVGRYQSVRVENLNQEGLKSGIPQESVSDHLHSLFISTNCQMPIQLISIRRGIPKLQDP